MKLYLKVIGCSCYTCLPQTLLAAAQTRLKKVAPGTPPVAQRLLMIVTTNIAHTCTYMQTMAKDKK
jgi:hypothetical protein